MAYADSHTFLMGEHVILEPLTLEHVPALSLAAADGNLWELWYTSVPHANDMKAYVEKAIAQEQLGEALAFAVRDKTSGEVIGSTRICQWDQPNRRLEIGYTWYAKRAQRTGVNTETKLLLLDYAFSTLDVMAVEFRTHWHNQASRQAITRLGAKQDGVLRNHKLLKDGTVRDTVVYSIIDSEWPTVKQHLKHRLAHYQQQFSNSIAHSEINY
ncbi:MULTISPECIES: GNAT family protein [unclassified Shewanella]|uniref:GNAT family N-acetyltransferase n=1 Tax=unclassified Shewanella TaxID=196818 RepID=UPI000C84B407|nr:MULTISPECIES: GNAT family protein [unclassified Shewanella]MDO6618824.1 GNAT family protein [Shewanella sp. 6_MG-2023]MDO6640377.1 GNAT family protein [Shewanella sp. 5_MG-2023]MDO6677839.1 GNAT family protein [Shewanella sp. 4_MG-2023]MDO6775216.1 GNAT family protein [Shewanella sp. 3_MG-2023]PMG29696.1 GNAT family N-acetyltransferase [Shewanella sp. 10N.286.52.C2]